MLASACHVDQSQCDTCQHVINSAFSHFQKWLKPRKFLTNSYELRKVQDQDQNSSKIELYVMNPCLSAFGSFWTSIASLCYSIDVANTTIIWSLQTRRRTRRTRIVSTMRSMEMTTLKVPHPIQSCSSYYVWLIQNCYCFTLQLQSYYDRTCMVVCLLDGLYLDATLPCIPCY